MWVIPSQGHQEARPIYVPWDPSIQWMLIQHLLPYCRQPMLHREHPCTLHCKMSNMQSRPGMPANTQKETGVIPICIRWGSKVKLSIVLWMESLSIPTSNPRTENAATAALMKLWVPIAFRVPNCRLVTSSEEGNLKVATLAAVSTFIDKYDG